MKRIRFGLGLLLLVQLACGVESISPETFCEMKGGTWHKSTEDREAYCEPAKPTPRSIIENQPGENSTEVSSTSQEVPTEKYITPTPASVQECNATLYIQSQVEIIKNTQEPYYRECDYKLTLSNIHASEEIWVVRRTNTNVHSSATNSDNSYWYSDMLIAGQSWEKQFRSTYFTDGQSSREGVDKVAGVFNRPECLHLLNSSEVEAISQTVEWACAP